MKFRAVVQVVGSKFDPCVEGEVIVTYDSRENAERVAGAIGEVEAGSLESACFLVNELAAMYERGVQ